MKNLLVSILLWLWAMHLQAAAVHYDESIHGDVGNAYWQSGVVDFVFGVGTNVFIGGISGDNFADQYDFDTFSVEVPEGLVVNNIRAFFYPDLSTKFGSTGFNVHDDQPIPGGYFGNILVVTYETGPEREYITTVDIDVPLAAGIYQFHNPGVGYNNAQVGDHITYAVDYRLEFDVAPVPLPAPLLLFSSSLFCLFMTKYKLKA